MKGLYYCIIICFFLTPAFAQNNYSSFGKVLTPKGDLKVFLIYASFEDEPPITLGEWPYDIDLPPWSHKELFYSNINELTKDTTDRKYNISDFYYKSSLAKFKLTSEVLPVRIRINAQGVYGFSQCNRKVMEKMKELYPDFDWKPYDQRKNQPHYKFDNSTSKPDQKPDYVIIAYRYHPSWPKQPAAGMQNWARNYSQLDGLHGFDYNGYTFDGAGFTMAGFDGRPDMFHGIFIHELAHEMFSCPHYSGVNGATGNYFHLPCNGWDMMNQLGGTTSNVFEKWVLGWTEITHDLKNNKDNGIYNIHDAETTGECIRIKIPYSNSQYLWIENRELKSSLDHKPWRNQLYNTPEGSKGIADKESGVYMFIEDVLESRNSINEELVYDMDKVNGIYPLHAEGNFDYYPPKSFTLSPGEYWNNKLYWFERAEANPISGLNPYINYRGDLDSNGQINNVPKSYGAFNGMSSTESFPIVKEVINGKPILTYANGGGRNNDALKLRRSDAFQQGDKIGLGNNPIITNRPKYNWETGHQGFYNLNGISISILERKNGIAKIKVLFNDIYIANDTRWCGNIILHSVPEAKNGYSANLNKNKILHINKSLIPNSHILPFIDKSIFIIDSGATFHAEEGSKINLTQGSKIIIKNGGKLLLDKNSRLAIDSTSQLIVELAGSVWLHKQATIETTNKNNIQLEIFSGIKGNGKINHPYK